MTRLGWKAPSPIRAQTIFKMVDAEVFLEVGLSGGSLTFEHYCNHVTFIVGANGRVT